MFSVAELPGLISGVASDVPCTVSWWDTVPLFSTFGMSPTAPETIAGVILNSESCTTTVAGPATAVPCWLSACAAQLAAKMLAINAIPASTTPITIHVERAVSRAANNSRSRHNSSRAPLAPGSA